MYSVIYKTICIPTGKIYIGQTITLNKNYYGSGKIIFNVIKRHSLSAFKREILEECNSKEQLDISEMYWIAVLSAQDKNIGYNIANGGNGTGTVSEETKQKIREARKIKPSPGNTGKTHSTEARKRISESLKGMPAWNKGISMTEEQKEKLSIIASERIGNKNPFYGRTHSEETKKKISETKRNKKILDK